MLLFKLGLIWLVSNENLLTFSLILLPTLVCNSQIQSSFSL